MATKTRTDLSCFYNVTDPHYLWHGRSNWIRYRILKYFICCLRDVIQTIVIDLSNSIYNTSISGVKFSWTTLYIVIKKALRADPLDSTPSLLHVLYLSPYQWKSQGCMGAFSCLSPSIHCIVASPFLIVLSSLFLDIPQNTLRPISDDCPPSQFALSLLPLPQPQSA